MFATVLSESHLQINDVFEKLGLNHASLCFFTKTTYYSILVHNIPFILYTYFYTNEYLSMDIYICIDLIYQTQATGLKPTTYPKGLGPFSS